MDQELTSKNFLRFITRRGLSRERADANMDRSSTEQSSSSKTATPMDVDDINNRRSSLVYTRPGYSGMDGHQHRPTRMSDTFGTNRNRHAVRPPVPVSHHDSLQRLPSSSSHATSRPPPAPQSSADRRYNRSPNDDQPSKKFYRCEYCGLSFGRKHHKERHVANIHRHVRAYHSFISFHFIHGLFRECVSVFFLYYRGDTFSFSASTMCVSVFIFFVHFRSPHTSTS